MLIVVIVGDELAFLGKVGCLLGQHKSLYKIRIIKGKIHGFLYLLYILLYMLLYIKNVMNRKFIGYFIHLQYFYIANPSESDSSLTFPLENISNFRG